MARMRNLWLGGCVVAGLWLVGSVTVGAEPPRGGRGPGRFAGPGGGLPSVDQVFQHLDKNQDGKLTKEELPERMAERMQQADKDGDGAITKAELEAARQQWQGQGKAQGQGQGPGGMPSVDQMFQRLDKNNDGQLTKEELPEGWGERLLRADADGNGAVTKQELEAARQKLAAGAGRGGFEPGQLFARADKNGDGKLTKDELPEPWAERLLRLDKDGDGAISKAELAEARPLQRPHQPGQRKPGAAKDADK